jgi:hypothetical protein
MSDEEDSFRERLFKRLEFPMLAIDSIGAYWRLFKKTRHSRGLFHSSKDW